MRELESCIKRAVILTGGPLIGPRELGLPAAPQFDTPVNLRQVRDAAGYRVMVTALARSNGSIVKAADMLGVSRPTLHDLMHHHGIRIAP